MTRRARAYEARVRVRRFRAGLGPEGDAVATVGDGAGVGALDGGGDPTGGGSADGVGDVGPVEDPRSPDRNGPPARPTGAAPLFAGTVQLVDGEPFTVRTVTGAAAVKTYVCPRCLQAIPARFPHLVVWPVESRLDGTEGLSVRRHWHRHCWGSHVRTAGSRRPR